MSDNVGAESVPRIEAPLVTVCGSEGTKDVRARMPLTTAEAAEVIPIKKLGVDVELREQPCWVGERGSFHYAVVDGCRDCGGLCGSCARSALYDGRTNGLKVCQPLRNDEVLLKPVAGAKLSTVDR